MLPSVLPQDRRPAEPPPRLPSYRGGSAAAAMEQIRQRRAARAKDPSRRHQRRCPSRSGRARWWARPAATVPRHGRAIGNPHRSAGPGGSRFTGLRRACSGTAPAARAGAARLNDESPDMRGFPSAPERTRTSTDHSVHKALNLARLPIPPQALGAASIAPGYCSPAVCVSRLRRLAARDRPCRRRIAGFLMGPRLGGGLSPSASRATFTNTCSSLIARRAPSKEQRNGPDQAPAGDLRIH